jgi:hypothetical protein
MFTVFAAEPDAEKPKISAQAAGALSGFQLKRGFPHRPGGAAEPTVVAPSAIAFDENGRLFVAEMRDYPNGREQKPASGPGSIAGRHRWRRHA